MTERSMWWVGLVEEPWLLDEEETAEELLAICRRGDDREEQVPE